jgi:hypothetical protein
MQGTCIDCGGIVCKSVVVEYRENSRAEIEREVVRCTEWCWMRCGACCMHARHVVAGWDAKVGTGCADRRVRTEELSALKLRNHQV